MCLLDRPVMFSSDSMEMVVPDGMATVAHDESAAAFRKAGASSEPSVSPASRLQQFQLEVKSSARIQWPQGPETRTCHQCRRKTARRHQICNRGNTRSEGKSCGYAFCEGCLVTRCACILFVPLMRVAHLNKLSYGATFRNLTYEGTENFECPVCRGFCNCTRCTDQRGENYVGPRRRDA